jgi:hypothetical protein
MTFVRRWAGRAFGTHTGNLYIAFEGDDKSLTGTLRFNDSNAGIAVYAVSGSFDGARLALSATPQTAPQGFTLSPLQATAMLNSKGELRGDWQAQSGAGGTLILHPHDRGDDVAASERMTAQLHTVRHHFGAVAIDRDEFVAIAEEIQQDFSKGLGVVTWVAITEQTRSLKDFKEIKSFGVEAFKLIKFYAQEPDENGLNRIVNIEFGPQVNSVLTQGSREAWVLGELERIRQRVRPFERSYATNFLKRFGIGLNQVLVILALTAAPSIGGFWDRLIFVAAVLGAISAVWKIHNRFLPFAVIYTGNKPTSLVRRVGPSIFSWAISILGTILAGVIGAYLKGWLHIPLS